MLHPRFASDDLTSALEGVRFASAPQRENVSRRKLGVPELTIDFLDLADINFLNDVARIGSTKIGPPDLSQDTPFIAAINHPDRLGISLSVAAHRTG
jgi:hypothetical protein